MSYNSRIIICVLVIYHVHSSCADIGVMDMLSKIATNIYNNLKLGAFENDDTIVQERENNEMSLMQEIRTGRHGRGAVHVYGRHRPEGRMRDKQRPINVIDVRASYDDGGQ